MIFSHRPTCLFRNRLVLVPVLIYKLAILTLRKLKVVASYVFGLWTQHLRSVKKFKRRDLSTEDWEGSISHSNRYDQLLQRSPVINNFIYDTQGSCFDFHGNE